VIIIKIIVVSMLLFIIMIFSFKAYGSYHANSIPDEVVLFNQYYGEIGKSTTPSKVLYLVFVNKKGEKFRITGDLNSDNDSLIRVKSLYKIRIGSNLPSEETVYDALIEKPNFLMDLFVNIIVIFILFITLSGYYKIFIKKAAQQGDAPEPASPAR
jgi:hypothetical protein